MDSHVKKLTIYAYSDKRLEKKDSDQFVVPINPEKYARSVKIEHDAKSPQGGQGSEARFKSSAPEKLQLEFVLDGTNTIYGYAQTGQTVLQQVTKFRDTVYKLKGDIHQPRFLKIVWKDFTFHCTLSEMTVSFVLFDAEGAPLRAKVSATFLEHKETERRVREENQSSPDLTHTRILEDQDSLPLLTHRIYGKSDYYLEVALANDLTTFRPLPSRKGRLTFPPLDKTAP
jgi:hypothetical protein